MSDVSARILARKSVSVSASWNASYRPNAQRTMYVGCVWWTAVAGNSVSATVVRRLTALDLAWTLVLSTLLSRVVVSASSHHVS